MGITDVGVSAVKLLSPEAAHTATIKALKRGLGVPKRAAVDDPMLTLELPRSELKLLNPVGLAAGFDKNCDVPSAMARFGFGMVECGTVTPLPQAGNPKPRLFRLPEDGAVINRMGFNNKGLDYFRKRLMRYKGLAPIGANVGANKTSEDRIQDYVEGIGAVWARADYITINISSPNTPGLRGLQDKASLEALLGRCGDTCAALSGTRPVFLKVAPDLDAAAIKDICEVVRAHSSWLTGLIVSNTTLARPDDLQSIYKREPGGLSGAPLMAASTKVLLAFARELNGEFDLIGAGGIASGADAYAKIRAGAHAVQLYSALVYHGPKLVTEIKRDLIGRLKEDGFKSVTEAVGADV
jgi:dihydroorotate dehydrogenase